MTVTRRALLGGAAVAGVAGAALVLGLPGAKRTEPVAAPPGVDPVQFAKDRFLIHWNCAQAVLEALAGQSGLPPEILTRITTPFAAGMWNGLTCGAVTGAMMAIGLAVGRASDRDSRAADRTADKLRALTKALTAQYGDLTCSALLGTDMATPEGIKQAAGKGLFKSKCPLLVQASTREALILLA